MWYKLPNWRAYDTLAHVKQKIQICWLFLTSPIASSVLQFGDFVSRYRSAAKGPFPNKKLAPSLFHTFWAPKMLMPFGPPTFSLFYILFRFLGWFQWSLREASTAKFQSKSIRFEKGVKSKFQDFHLPSARLVQLQTRTVHNEATTLFLYFSNLHSHFSLCIPNSDESNVTGGQQVACLLLPAYHQTRSTTWNKRNLN